jgi:hypothetical protein
MQRTARAMGKVGKRATRNTQHIMKNQSWLDVVLVMHDA